MSGLCTLSGMVELILVRHGETEWNRNLKIMGDLPIPLNDTGKRQVADLADYFSRGEFHTIYTSPMVRARETAEGFRGERETPILDEPALAEINYGPWVGKTFAEVRDLPEFADYHLRPEESQVPGGESMKGVAERLDSFFERIREKHQGERVVAVSHADVIKIALVKCLNVSLNDMHRIRIDNASFSVTSLHSRFERVLIMNGLPQLGDFFEKNGLFAKYDPFKGKRGS